MARPFAASWLELPTLQVAKRLLGSKLVTIQRNQRTAGMIVEVEAYRGDIDQAAHSFGGPSRRNQVMFWSAGHCYVYLIYGVHYCVNVVTEVEGIGAAVLIRALQPLEGIDVMLMRRGAGRRLPSISAAQAIRAKGLLAPHPKLLTLTNGPAKLCQAMGIGPRMSGEHLLHSVRIRLEAYSIIPAVQIGRSLRIGINKSKELPWRFYIKNNPWLSRSDPKN